MRILIVGAGGVGGFIGSQINSSDFEIVYVARGKRLDFLKKNGLKVKSKLGDKVIENLVLLIVFGVLIVGTYVMITSNYKIDKMYEINRDNIFLEIESQKQNRDFPAFNYLNFLWVWGVGATE